MHKQHIPTWFLPELKLAARPALLLLATLLLFGLGAALKQGQTKPHSESAGFSLPPAASCLKLDSTGAKTPESQPAPALAADAADTQSGPKQPIVAVAEENVTAPKDISAPAPDSAGELQLSDSPGPYQMPDLAVEPPKPETVDAVPTNEPPARQVFDEEMFRNSQRGDTPMIHNWKMLGLQTVLAAALATAPSPSYAADEQSKKGEVTLQDLKKSLDAIQKEVDKIPTMALNFDLMAGDIKILKDKVERLEKEVDNLRSRSTSFYSPTTGAGTGRVRLVNTFPAEMRIVLNSIVYPLAPNETRDVPLPAGRFSYQVLDIPGFATRTRNLVANETYAITVFPQ